MRTPPNERLRSDRADETPERKCILSGEHAARDSLIRLAISPEGPDGTCIVLPDALARAPGRGAWIGVSQAGLGEALRSGKLRGALARAFKGTQFEIPADLPVRTEQALRKALIERLGLEFRAGSLIMGADRIAEQARGGAVAWLGHASDASEDGCRKLDQAYRVGKDAEGSSQRGLRLPLDRAALSVALGRENVVHLALADEASAHRVAIPLGRLTRFLGVNPAAETVSGHGAADDAGHAAMTAI